MTLINNSLGIIVGSEFAVQPSRETRLCNGRNIAYNSPGHTVCEWNNVPRMFTVFIVFNVYLHIRIWNGQKPMHISVENKYCCTSHCTGNPVRIFRPALAAGEAGKRFFHILQIQNSDSSCHRWLYFSVFYSYFPPTLLRELFFYAGSRWIWIDFGSNVSVQRNFASLKNMAGCQDHVASQTIAALHLFLEV